jgi:hypothetical protein
LDRFGHEAVDSHELHDGPDAWCGTHALPLHVQLQVMTSVRAWGDRKQRRRLTSGPYTVDVRFVDIKASDADADVPQSNIDTSLILMNEHFSTTEFKFRWIETVRVVNSNFATCEFENADKHASIGQAYRQGVSSIVSSISFNRNIRSSTHSFLFSEKCVVVVVAIRSP